MFNRKDKNVLHSDSEVHAQTPRGLPHQFTRFQRTHIIALITCIVCLMG